MKKMFFVAALAVLGMNQSQAQVKFGVKAGPQLTNFVGSDVEGSDSKFGFNAGGYANIRFATDFAFQPELLYSLQGAKEEESESIGSIKQTYENVINLSYINVPLMLKWYAYDGFNVEFGPQVGFNVSAKGKSTHTISGDLEGANGSTETKYDLEDVPSIDFGVNIGAGYEMANGLNFGLRYGRGLTSISENEGDKEDKIKAFNSVISLGVGYTF